MPESRRRKTTPEKQEAKNEAGPPVPKLWEEMSPDGKRESIFKQMEEIGEELRDRKGRQKRAAADMK